MKGVTQKKFGKTKKRPNPKNPKVKPAGVHKPTKVRIKGYTAQLKGTGSRPKR